MRYPGGKAKALTFSYDDGVVEDRHLIELFLKHGVKGTFNLSPEMFGRTCENEPHQQWMKTPDIKDTYTGTGMEVSLHGYSHPELPKMDDAALLWEVLLNRKLLEDLFGHRVTGLAYPQGAYDARVKSLLSKAGVKYARIANSGSLSFDPHPADWFEWIPTAHHGHPELMKLAERFINAKPTVNPWDNNSKPMLFYVWGHAYEFRWSDNWYIMEDFLKAISFKDDIWYATNMEIYEYTAAFDRLEYSVERNMVYNPSALKVWILHDEKIIEVEPGAEIRI